MLTALIVLKHAGYFKTARLLFAQCGNCASKQTDDTNQLNIHFMYRQLRSDFHVTPHSRRLCCRLLEKKVVIH